MAAKAIAPTIDARHFSIRNTLNPEKNCCRCNNTSQTNKYLHTNPAATKECDIQIYKRCGKNWVIQEANMSDLRYKCPSGNILNPLNRFDSKEVT